MQIEQMPIADLGFTSKCNKYQCQSQTIFTFCIMLCVVKLIWTDLSTQCVDIHVYHPKIPLHILTHMSLSSQKKSHYWIGTDMMQRIMTHPDIQFTHSPIGVKLYISLCGKLSSVVVLSSAKLIFFVKFTSVKHLYILKLCCNFLNVSHSTSFK
jgi:hypothetical protein